MGSKRQRCNRGPLSHRLALLLVLALAGALLAAATAGNAPTTDSALPVSVGGLSEVTAIAAGTDHSLALRADGTVYAWGDNTTGELGNGTTTSSSVPIQVSGLTGVTAIAAGSGFSLAL